MPVFGSEENRLDVATPVRSAQGPDAEMRDQAACDHLDKNARLGRSKTGDRQAGRRRAGQGVKTVSNSQILMQRIGAGIAHVRSTDFHHMRPTEPKAIERLRQGYHHGVGLCGKVLANLS